MGQDCDLYASFSGAIARRGALRDAAKGPFGYMAPSGASKGGKGRYMLYVAARAGIQAEMFTRDPATKRGWATLNKVPDLSKGRAQMMVTLYDLAIKSTTLSMRSIFGVPSYVRDRFAARFTAYLDLPTAGT